MLLVVLQGGPYFCNNNPKLAAMIDFLENTDDEDACNILLTSDNFYIGQDGLLYHIDFNRRRNARESFSQLAVAAALRFDISVMYMIILPVLILA